MASHRTGTAPARPYRPTLTSNRTAERSPLTPRLAATAIVSAPQVATRKTNHTTPRTNGKHESAQEDDGFDSDNVTPRSAKRRSRVDSSNVTPMQSNGAPALLRAQTASPQLMASIKSDSVAVLSAGKLGTSRSPLSDTGSQMAFTPFVRSQTGPSLGGRVNDDAQFFHASDAGKVEVEIKRPEARRPAAFVYADGQQEIAIHTSRTSSPTRSEIGASAQWQRLSSEPPMSSARSPAMLSPALSAISSSSPFFAAPSQPLTQQARSPSPPKDNIHLSYRKGASQIFGSRPSPIPSPRATFEQLPDRRPSFQRAIASHRKSPSLSSIDSGFSQNSRRRSDGPGSSPLRDDGDDAQSPQASPTSRPPPVFPNIETSMELSSSEPKDGTKSPTKSVAELAADARRERKLLDLEISNSSLMAINASLEREMRRQKMELKRFRRLSRAGRFSFAPLDGDRSSLGTVSEYGGDGIDTDFSAFGPASGLSELYEDMSDSDDEGSSLTSGELGSEGRHDRLAKDDQRLRADLEKHKELLVQSQMMNQSLRRCTYATEEMIKDGQRALDYTVRVSDIKLGGRVLSDLDDDNEDEHGQAVRQIEVEDDFDQPVVVSPISPAGIEDNAHGFMELWGGVGRNASLEHWQNTDQTTSEDNGRGDRDSGIEVDQKV